MNADERELLKAELREEILEELSRKSNRRALGLETVRKKWFFGPNKKFQFENSKMAQFFGTDQHKVWDAVRSLTRLIFHKGSCSQLENLNQEKVEYVANALCELVYSLAEENAGQDEKGA